MSKRRWAIVNKADRAGQRPREWPRASLVLHFDEDDAMLRLNSKQAPARFDFEVIQVEVRGDESPMWVQVGTEPDSGEQREVTTLGDLRAALDNAGWAKLGHERYPAVTWTRVHGDTSVTGLWSGRATMTVDNADITGSWHGPPAAIWKMLRQMGMV